MMWIDTVEVRLRRLQRFAPRAGQASNVAHSHQTVPSATMSTSRLAGALVSGATGSIP